jgi:hypothetical protein
LAAKWLAVGGAISSQAEFLKRFHRSSFIVHRSSFIAQLSLPEPRDPTMTNER